MQAVASHPSHTRLLTGWAVFPTSFPGADAIKEREQQQAAHDREAAESNSHGRHAHEQQNNVSPAGSLRPSVIQDEQLQMHDDSDEESPRASSHHQNASSPSQSASPDKAGKPGAGGDPQQAEEFSNFQYWRPQPMAVEDAP